LCHPSLIFRNVRSFLRENRQKSLVFANSRWEMLLKTIGQLLGTAKREASGNSQRLLDSSRAILKGHWKAAGKCPDM
jgi:hypothetical protein